MEVKSNTYTMLVRPVLDYASPAWDSTSSEDIMRLEKVQRQAAQFVHGNYSERNLGCVTRMVNNLNWETLESRRKKERLAMLYKIQHGAVDMDTGDILRLNIRRTSGQQRLYQSLAPEVSRDRHIRGKQRLYQRQTHQRLDFYTNYSQELISGNHLRLESSPSSNSESGFFTG